jgi:hypothetical protein
MNPCYFSVFNYVLCAGFAFATVFTIVCRKAIYFRVQFGVWQSQRGAERLVRKTLKSAIGKIEEGISNRCKAKEEFDKCPSLAAPLQQKRKAWLKAESRERAAVRYYKALAKSAKYFGFYEECGLADEELRRLKVKLAA